MGEKEDYLTSYRVFFENFAATVNPEDQLPVHIAGYTITEAELPGEVLYWTTQYLTEKQCPQTLMTPLRRIILDEVRVASKNQPNEFGYKSDESVYIALRLMQAVTARVNDVCLRYLDNSKLDTLPPPPPLEQRDLKTVSCATKNSRRVMEDRHVEIGNLEALFGVETTEPTSFYAVYDGHAGSAAATYCAAHLHQYLVESPHFTADLRRAMRDAFLRTDAEFIRKSNQERACGGSTAVCVCVRARRLLAGWAGDSQALLAKRMRLMQLVHPHKPGRQDEKNRIESSGGTVMYWGTWRVNGQLAVSRAIGDAQYKPYVTARPEIATVDLDGDEDFVVVACDGLWDFVSEDDVALAVYRQLAEDPDDLKAVTKRLIVQAKRQGSADNISIIVVFLKDPRDIVADNCPPMDLGLDNALANAPPFAVDKEACKRQVDAAAADAATAGDCNDADADAEADAGDNGVDNFDSDSEDLGPETAVDADDIDADARNHEPAPSTPLAHTVEESHVDGALVDNVAESGEDSEDEWNYYKGEGERDEHNPSDEPDEPPHSETPCQDNSAWESSSVDMNSSPLNPEAPVFVPGSVTGADVLLAESPRKPLPMDDIELPDVAQFETEADIRPAELLDLDNCDQLNGHHNVSGDEAIKEPFNGNDRCNMDSLGFGFNVGIEPDKVKDTGLIQDFERIQKDTTDFCNIQVFQTHTETNPFDDEGNDELFERLKNKERDPMSMSFYQEKDDDTCERLSKNESHVDLNAVQPLPDSDDEDIQQNGVCEIVSDTDKENINPDQHRNLFETETNMQEPNNDIMILNDRTEVFSSNLCNLGQEDNFVDYNITNSDNIQSLSNMEFESTNIPQETVLQTDTPESHKLLFEQIPEIPDGKSSELGFTNDDIQDPSESEKDTRVITPQDELPQDEMEYKVESSTEDVQEQIKEGLHDPLEAEPAESINSGLLAQDFKNDHQDSEVVSPLELPSDYHKNLDETEDDVSQELVSPEIKHELVDNVDVDIHHNVETLHDVVPELEIKLDNEVTEVEINAISSGNTNLEHLESEEVCQLHENSQSESLDQEESLCVKESTPRQSPLPTEAPLLDVLQTNEVPVSSESLFPTENITANVPSLPKESIETLDELECQKSPLFQQNETSVNNLIHSEDATLFTDNVKSEQFDQELEAPTMQSLLLSESPLPIKSPVPETVEDQNEAGLLKESPLPPEVIKQAPATAFDETPVMIPSACGVQEAFDDTVTMETAIELRNKSPLPAEVPLPRESPVPVESPVPTESPAPTASPVPAEFDVPDEATFAADNPQLGDTILTESTVPIESPIPAISPIPTDLIMASKSPIPVESPVPARSPIVDECFISAKSPILPDSPVPARSPIPDQSLVPEKSTITSESPVPTKSPIPDECSIPAKSPIPFESTSPAKSPLPDEPFTTAESLLPIESSMKSESPLLSEPVESNVKDSSVAVKSPIPVETLEAEALEQITSIPSTVEPIITTDELILQMDQIEAPMVSHSPVLETSSGPAPDVVPDESVELSHPMRSELVTDIDIGIPESHAQEICVPVTSEIILDETVQPPAVVTPPPTPAVEPAPPTVSEAALAADPVAPIAAVAAVAAAGVAVAGAAVAAKSKTSAPTKKSPTTPTAKSDTRTSKPVPKTTSTPRTPTAATKKPDAAAKPSTATSRLSTTKAPTTTTKPATPGTKAATVPTKAATPASKAATPSSKSTTPASRITPAAKQVTSATKATTTTSKPTTPAAATASRTAATKPGSPTTKPAVREAPAAARAVPRSTTAPRPAAPKPPPKAAPAPRPTTMRAAPLAAKPAAAKPKPKPSDKPLTNGDTKEAKPAAKPAPRPAVTARPAPRVPSAPTTVPPKSASAKPAPRATAPLDKQSKDLANKRITAKTAPPRTALTKTTTGSKNTVMKAVPKKGADSSKKEQIVKEALANGAADEPVKLPPSPPAHDNALLPDVIA